MWCLFETTRNVHVYICRKRSVVADIVTTNVTISTTIVGKENTQNRDVTTVAEGPASEKVQPLGPTKK